MAYSFKSAFFSWMLVSKKKKKKILLLDSKITSDLPGQYDKSADFASREFLDR